MILSKLRSYSFSKPIRKVNCVFPSYNDSITLTGLKTIGQDCLAHFNKDGQLQYQIEFHDFIDTFCQLSQKQFAILRVEKQQIWTINVETQVIQKYFHEFIFGVSCQCHLDYFCDSKLLCVREHGDNSDQIINLTYYAVPFVTTPPPPKVEVEMNDLFQDNKAKTNEDIQFLVPYAVLNNFENWNPCHIVKKVNSKSRYIWGQMRHKDVVKVLSAEIINEKVIVTTLKIDLYQLCLPYRLNSLELAIIEMWELRPGQLLLFTSTNRTKETCENSNKKVINNTFVWNINKETIRQSLFTFDPICHDLQIDIVGTPTFSMFRTFYFREKEVMESPAYFVNNLDQKIIQQQKWKCSHLQKYFVPAYLNDTIVEASYENLEVRQITVRTIKKVLKSELSIFLLMNMEGEDKKDYDDWDEDLVLDVIRSLDYDV